MWQASMWLAASVFMITGRFPTEPRFVLVSQLQRCALSMRSNIAEDHGRNSTGALLNHLSTAAGSLRELETRIELAPRPSLLAKGAMPVLAEQSDRAGRMLSRLTTAVKAT